MNVRKVKREGKGRVGAKEETMEGRGIGKCEGC